MPTQEALRWLRCMALVSVAGFGCAHRDGTSHGVAPAWAWGHVDPAAWCGVGVAGAAFRGAQAEAPKRLSAERAAKNLAGALASHVSEVVVDRQHNEASQVTWMRHIQVDQDLIDAVHDAAEVTHWFDRDGDGPFRQEGFTYAQACLSPDAAGALMGFNAGPQAPPTATARGDAPPAWLERAGRRADGRLCAVGFSLPAFHPERTFENVVGDVRMQLADVMRTLVASYSEDRNAKGSRPVVKAMVVASNEALSRGVFVTDFWFDDDGVGPRGIRRSTYGWGCAYPHNILRDAMAQLTSRKRLSKKRLEDVRRHADAAFDALSTAEMQISDGQRALVQPR